jgi:hypothetical protein
VYTPMSERKLRYLCAGLYPVEADNVVHAGLLFALQIARRKHGPKARCSKLDLRGSIRPGGATFEAVGGVPPRREPYQFTVLIDRQSKEGCRCQHVSSDSVGNPLPVMPD